MRHLIHGIPRQLVQLNLFFDRRKSSPLTLTDERRTTRLYLLIWTSVFTILLLYNTVAEETITIQVPNPTEDIFARLYATHSGSLHCPCTPNVISYSHFVNGSAQLHQICSSPFIENAWITNIFGDGNWSNFATNQFRGRGVAYFLVQKSLCNYAQVIVEGAIRDLHTRGIPNGKLISKERLFPQIRLIFDSSKSWNENGFVLMLRAGREAMQMNHLMHHFTSNWMFSPQNTRNVSNYRIGTHPVSHGTDCSCAAASACTEPVYVDDEPVPGFVLSCLPMESLLRSTLSCLYNQTCLQLINFENSSSIRPLDSSQFSRYSINSTGQDLASGAFIEEWSLNISYSDFFSACDSSMCTYSVPHRKDTLRVITILLGLYGGLTLIIRTVVPWLIAVSQRIVRLWLRRGNAAVVPHA